MLRRHGGNLIRASAEFNIPLDAWLDLSTGISPWVWPVPPVPEKIWQRLPSEDNDLEVAAASRYGCEVESVLAVPGSQSVIQLLPKTVAPHQHDVVALPRSGYREHKLAWESAGHKSVSYGSKTELLEVISQKSVSHAVVINPNNPTGELVDPTLLLKAAEILATRNGFLVVDEAFVDAVPNFSVSRFCPLPGLVVLRSIGKFYGLAGIRLGFLLAEKSLWNNLQTQLPLWSVSTNARWIGEQVLSDEEWWIAQSSRLREAGMNWLILLQQWFPELTLTLSPLFVTGSASHQVCNALYNRLARSGILVRLFEEDEGIVALRFGLPDEAMLKKLQSRLAKNTEAVE